MSKMGISIGIAWLIPCFAGQPTHAEDTASAPLLTIPSYAYAARFSPDGKQIMVGEGSFLNDYAALFDAQTGDKIRNFSGHTAHVFSVAFSGDGSKVLTGSLDSTSRLWNARTGELIKTLSLRKERILGVALSPDGSKALLSITGQITYLWDIEADTAQKIFYQTASVDATPRYPAFSPDGNQAITGADSTVRLWDVRTGKMVRYFTFQSKLLWPIAFSRDGTRIVAGMYEGTICVWNTSTGDTIRTFKNRDFRNWTRAAVISPDGNKILAQDDTTVVLWDVTTGKRIRTFIGPKGAAKGKEYPGALAFSPDGTKIITAATATGLLCVWNISDVVSAKRGAALPASAPGAVFLGFDQAAIRFSLLPNGPMTRNGYTLTLVNPSGELAAELDDPSGMGSRLEFRAPSPLQRGRYFYQLIHENTVLSNGAIISE